MLARTLANLALLTPGLLGQVGWVDVSPAVSPSPRSSHAMAYDAARQRVVLFGGQPGGAPLTDTWEWDGSTWTRKTPAVMPPRASTPEMVFDEARQVSVLVLQQPGGGMKTYTWNGVDWTDRGLAPFPDRDEFAMAYDRSRQEVVLYGGYPRLSDTWIWDGSSWSQATPRVSPPAREDHAMAFDPASGRVALFGGKVSHTSVTLPDLWEWNGNNWIERFPATSPSTNIEGDAVTDSSLGDVLYFGGRDLSAANTCVPEYGYETWELSNGRFSLAFLTSSPARRAGHAMAYDSMRQVVVLFGGRNCGGRMGDTWELQRGPAASYSTFGSGCMGSRGIPSLAPRAGSLPRVGTSFTVQVNNMPFNTPAFLFLGLSNQNYGTVSLPFDLGSLGAPGCTLYVSGDELHTVTNVLGVGIWSFTVPAFPGSVFFNQAFVLDPPANSLGLTVSNAGRGVIGS